MKFLRGPTDNLYKFVAISGLTLFVLAAYLANRAIERRDDVLRDALVKSAESNALTFAFARQTDMRVMLQSIDVSDIALRCTLLDIEREKLKVESALISKEAAELTERALSNVDVTVDESSMEAQRKQLQDNAKALEKRHQDTVKAFESYYEKALKINSSYHDLLSRAEKWFEGDSHSKREVSLMDSFYSLEMAQHLQTKNYLGRCLSTQSWRLLAL